MVRRRKPRSQALVRSTTQRWRALGSLVRVTRWRPRVPVRLVCPGASGSPGRRRRLIWGGDPACLEFSAEAVAAVAAVGPDLVGLVAGGLEVVDQRQQLPALVLVAGPEPHLQRPAGGVDGEVVLAGRKAAVDRARPDQVAPFFASTSEASTTTRDQSIPPRRSSSATSSASACAQTPRSIHSCSRRRQVSPLGKPSSRGRSTYRTPVTSR